MKLPQTPENLESGYYFYVNKIGEVELLLIEDRDMILVRHNKQWIKYQFSHEYLSSPDGMPIVVTQIEDAIALVDDYQFRGIKISQNELSKFHVIF